MIKKQPLPQSHIPTRKRRKLQRKTEKIVTKWSAARITDTYMFLKRPWKTIWANVIVGISRGVGFVIGVSIIGVLLITLIANLLSQFVSIPVIGEFSALIVKSVQTYLKNP